jgi:hypothetical protein
MERSAELNFSNHIGSQHLCAINQPADIGNRSSHLHPVHTTQQKNNNRYKQNKQYNENKRSSKHDRNELCV